MSNDEYKPRFSFEISFEQKERADKLLINYGLRRTLFSIILDDVLDLIQDHGGLAIGIIMSSKCKPSELLPSLQGIKQVVNKIGEP